MSASQTHPLAEQFESDHNVDTVDDIDEVGPVELHTHCYILTVE